MKKYIEDISQYEVIYIGAPVYWGIMPQEMITQLEKLDFSGKGSIPSQVKRVCKGANVLEDSIAIRGASAKSSKDKIENWL